MLKNMRLWVKLMASFGLAILTVVLVLTYTNLRDMRELIVDAERQALQVHFNALQRTTAVESRQAGDLVTLLASLHELQQAMAVQQRDALEALLMPIRTRLVDDFGVDGFSVHFPTGEPLVMLEDGSAGTSIELFQANLTEAGSSARQLHAGLAVRAEDLVIRASAPVIWSGQLVGWVALSIDMDERVLRRYRRDNSIELVLVRPGEQKMIVLASTLADPPLLEMAKLDRAWDGEPQLVERRVAGQDVAVYAGALNDLDGSPVAVLELAMDRSVYEQAYREARNAALLEGLLSVALGLLLAFVIAQHLVRRIEALSKGIGQVAGGDLVTAVEASGRDELGQLALSAEQMRERLHALVANVGEHARAVNAVAQEISAAVDQQAVSSTQMSSSVTEITSTMEEFSASSSEIAENSAAVVSMADQTLEHSRQGSDGVQTVLARMDDIRIDNERNLHEIVALGSKSKEIGKVMEIINTLADQTRLIAFNAALEASSAGESGKRFSVVAAEIRRLADSVTDSTSEIESRVAEIQDSINRLVVTSEKGGAVIGAGMAASRNAAEMLDEIVHAATETSSSAQQISLATQQQRTASNQVVIALREIVSANSYSAKSTARIVEIGQALTRLASELNQAAGQFLYVRSRQLEKPAATRAKPEKPL